MPAIRARELRRLTETMGAAACNRHLSEALDKKHLVPEDFSIRDLAEELIPDGREFVRSLDPRSKAAGGIELLEDGFGVNTAQFSNITGQIVFSKIKDSFANEAFVFSDLIPTIATRFNGEKIPGITDLGDVAEGVGEGNAYPLVGVSEDYIETPGTTKRGMVVPVTKEAIFFDRTGVLLMHASKVGEALGLNKEKRIINCVIDENSTDHRYKWRGNVIATYGNSSGTHTWDNLEASNALEDWTDIDKAEQLLAHMTDPNTGDPISVLADTIIVTPQLEAVAWRIINATQIAMQIGGFATSGNLSRTDAGNPIGGGGRMFTAKYRVVSSRLLRTQLATDTHWFLGAPAKAFAYMENWPITVTQAPSNSEAEFTQDIVVRYKASERGAAATLEPRLMVQNTA